ncbi:MAG: hypothetical protein QXZ17_07070 [Nitrososphaerota archaeon]
MPCEEERETLHDFSIEYVKLLAKVFGWKVKTSLGHEKGPDVIIEHILGKKEEIDAVMFVECEVGHDQGGAQEYFRRLGERLKKHVEEYRSNHSRIRFSVVIITNAPRRLSNYFRENGDEIEHTWGLKLVEGFNIFTVPVLIMKEVLPAIFVRAMGAIGRYA